MAYNSNKSHTETQSLHSSTLERGENAKIVQVNVAQFYYSVYLVIYDKIKF